MIQRLRENTLTFLHINDELESVTDNNGQKQEVVQILHETPINDRKSKFQAHLAQVYSVDEVSVVLKELMKNKKIREATHNMYAYRIRKSSQDSVQEGSNDDGETGAGSKVRVDSFLHTNRLRHNLIETFTSLEMEFRECEDALCAPTNKCR